MNCLDVAVRAAIVRISDGVTGVRTWRRDDSSSMVGSLLATCGRVLVATCRIGAVAAALACASITAAAAVVDCDGDADRDAMIGRLYGGEMCPGDDTNRDGRLSAADLIGAVHGPRITFIGIASPDGRLAPALGELPGGERVHFVNAGLGFRLVVEVAPGPSGAPVGTSVFDHHPSDPRRRGDLQVIADRTLGDGAAVVCDMSRGVPAVNPESFAFEQRVTNSINDLACRFAVATTPNATCTQNEFGQPGFAVAGSRVQFCMAVNGFVAFPSGDTRVSFQVRDAEGNLSPVRRLIVSVGSGPPPPTFSPTPSPTPTPEATATPTRTHTLPPTATRTPTATRSATATRVNTPLPTPTAVPPTSTPPRPSATPVQGTATRTPSRSATATQTPTHTVTRTATRTQTLRPGEPTHTPTRTPTATRTPSRTVTATRTHTRTHTAPPGTATRTPTITRTPTATRTPSATAAPATVTRTRTVTPLPTPTSSMPTGPRITYFGLATASDIAVAPSGEFVNGVPVYTRPFGSGFSIVVEAAPGAAGRPVGLSTYNLFGSPDLQIQVTRPLGNGSADVCDNEPPLVGGVPAINPPMFATEGNLVGIMNDLSCRFVDGRNQAIGRNCGGDPCLLQPNGNYACGGVGSTVQYCGLVSQNLSFPSGDTLVSVRVRDTQGNYGGVARIVVRIP